jgi:hypothetical protein
MTLALVLVGGATTVLIPTFASAAVARQGPVTLPGTSGTAAMTRSGTSGIRLPAWACHAKDQC